MSTRRSLWLEMLKSLMDRRFLLTGSSKINVVVVVSLRLFPPFFFLAFRLSCCNFELSPSIMESVKFQ